MERLTNRTNDGDLTLCGEIVNQESKQLYKASFNLEVYEDFFERTGLTPNEAIRLNAESKQYKDKLADGRMIELPCKIGEHFIYNSSIANFEFFVSYFTYCGKGSDVTVWGMCITEGENYLKELPICSGSELYSVCKKVCLKEMEADNG